MSFYPKDLKEEALKQRVANDFFAKFSYEPLERVDFALKNKGEALDIIYLLWAEAKKGKNFSLMIFMSLMKSSSQLFLRPYIKTQNRFVFVF